MQNQNGMSMWDRIHLLLVKIVLHLDTIIEEDLESVKDQIWDLYRDLQGI